MKYTLLFLLLHGAALLHAQQLKLLTSNLVMEKNNKWHKGQQVLDIGVVSGCGSSTKSFYFRNTGNKPLQITRVESMLKGCGNIYFSKKPVAPGAMDSIQVERMTCCYTDTVWETLSVFTNEPKGLSAEKFTVRSRFDEPKLAYSLSVNTVRVVTSCDSTYKVTITNSGNRPFRIAMLQSADPNIFVRYYAEENTIDCGSSLELSFKVTGNQRNGAPHQIDFELQACYNTAARLRGMIDIIY
jgi:hypothetical protein